MNCRRTMTQRQATPAGVRGLVRCLGLGLFVLAMPLLAMALPRPAGGQNRAAHPPARAAWNRNHPAARRKPLGKSLERLHQLPLDQQIRVLQKDRGFRRLPPARQQRIINRLRWFNSLPPQQQQRVLTRMHHLGELNPGQRQGLEQLYQAWKTFPPDRRKAFRRAYHQLNRMPPQQQQQTLQSDDYKSQFSPQEIGLLQQAISLHLPQDVVGSRPPQN